MKSNERVFVTGANGLLGTNTIIELLNEGYYVTGLLRNKTSYIANQHKNLELIEGNFLNRNDINKALVNCKYVVHIAAVTDPKLSKYDDFKKVNVTGTINIVEVAIQNNIKKIVYVSTANTFGYGSIDDLGNETKEMKNPFKNLFYSKSKKEAQDYVLACKNDIEVVIVNPTFIIGAYDSKPTSGRIVLMGLKKRFVLCPPGGKNFVGVKDVSQGIIKAIGKGKNGESYLLANNNLTYKEFFKLLRSLSKSQFFIIQLPKIIFLMLGFFGDMLRVLKIKTSLSIENMNALCADNFYSNDKAKNDLSVIFRPIELGIIDSISWFENTFQQPK